MPLETSRQARDSRAEYAEEVRDRILDHFRRRRTYGSTDDELEVTLHLLHQTASSARRWLVMAGLIAETDGRRKTRTGRNAVVWKLQQWAGLGPGGDRECRRLLTEMLTWPRTVKACKDRKGNTLPMCTWPRLPGDLQAVLEAMGKEQI